MSGSGRTGLVAAANRASGRRIAVIDDDPTGSQCVHDVDTVLDPELGDDIDAALAEPGSVCFVLTNSRSLERGPASEVNFRLGVALAENERRTGAPMTVVSRSDSTLRGHVQAETAALDRARRDVLGHGYDGIVLCPAFIEAGRITVDDVHLARIGDVLRPVGETEFARDTAFGYHSSNLADFIAETSGGTVDAGDVIRVSLDDIRGGGPDRVAELFQRADGGRFFAVNAAEQDDLDVIALGLVRAQQAGVTLLPRTGPSLVRAIAGLPVAPPLRGGELWPDGRRPGHGAVLVGSHTDATSAQVRAVLEAREVTLVELDVERVLDPGRTGRHVAEVIEAAVRALASSTVMVVTSRQLITDGGSGLDVSRQVSAALSAVAAGLQLADPAWVVAKGGITSHDIAVSGLGIRRARVLGQLMVGLISVLRPVTAPANVLGMPYVVFAGNVGDSGSLNHVIDVLEQPAR